MAVCGENILINYYYYSLLRQKTVHCYKNNGKKEKNTKMVKKTMHVKYNDNDKTEIVMKL